MRGLLVQSRVDVHKNARLTRHCRELFVQRVLAGRVQVAAQFGLRVGVSIRLKAVIVCLPLVYRPWVRAKFLTLPHGWVANSARFHEKPAYPRQYMESVRPPHAAYDAFGRARACVDGVQR